MAHNKNINHPHVGVTGGEEKIILKVIDLPCVGVVAVLLRAPSENTKDQPCAGVCGALIKMHVW